MISVCIATYNGEKYIKRQLESILSQLTDVDEIVISDDGSNDNTISIINELNDNRVRIIYNQGPHGFVPNFENAIRNAVGDIIILSDQDDEWITGKVNATVDAMKTYDFVYVDNVTVDSNGNVLEKSRVKALKIKKAF